MGKTLKFPEWKPDLTELGTGVSKVISGCVPQDDGYAPYLSLLAFTGALPSACRGTFFARNSDGTVTLFAGTSTRLYKLSNTDFTWSDVSKGGSAYTTLVTTQHWEFVQYNNLVVAVQINTAPQKFNLGVSSAFADLGGSPPQAAHIAVINRFILLSGLSSSNRRIQWCDLDAIETWTAGVGLADYQDLPDGGTTQQVAGGDSYGVVFQEQKIRSLVYAPGSPTVFQINVISTNDPLFGQYSVTAVGDKIFFCSAQGFKMIVGGNAPVFIGKERVDRTFFADVDSASLQLLIAASDPNKTRVYWAYKSLAGQTALFDKILALDFGIGEKGRWTLLPQLGEYLTSFARPGLTLENLDAIAPTPLPITGAANNGSGLIRLALAGGLSNASFAIAGQNFIVVQGVGGTTEANGTWQFTIIDSTHIDLIGSTFANAYTSGGAIGGSVDALPFSLDDVSTAAYAQLAAFTSAHKLGFFTGDSMEAILETDEQDGEGTLMFMSEMLLLTDSSDAMISVGYRASPQSAPSYTTEQQVDDQGRVFPIIEARYQRARVRIPSGSTWTWCRGIQPKGQAAGTE